MSNNLEEVISVCSHTLQLKMTKLQSFTRILSRVSLIPPSFPLRSDPPPVKTRNNGGPSQVVAEGERRISLYDILTSDAPIPPHGDRVGTVPRPSRGISSPAGSRRASIFDRIADVVFNEEQKEKELVDVVAVRSVVM